LQQGVLGYFLCYPKNLFVGIGGKAYSFGGVVIIT
jgi:hypothetical protein